MVQLALGIFLFGAVFGLRFKVMVLLPLTLALGLAAALIAPIIELTFLQCLEGFAICALALHSGYVFGSFARFAVAAARAARMVARSPRMAR